MLIKLTRRLQCIADLVTENARIVDIGTDHGYLPLFLLTSGRVNYAVASDLREGPLDCAKRNAIESGLEDRISLRLGAGLEKVGADECDTISIAGMGGETIAQILEDAPWTKEGNHTLLLQPMTMIPTLRQYLLSNGYKILQEKTCAEGRRMYVILRAVGGAASKQPSIKLSDCVLSKALLQDENAPAYLQYLLQKEEKTLHGMQRGDCVSQTQMEEQTKIVKDIKLALGGFA